MAIRQELLDELLKEYKNPEVTCHKIADSLFMQPDSFSQTQVD